MESGPGIVHVLDARVDPSRLEMLRSLLQRPAATSAHDVAWVGGGSLPLIPSGVPVRRLHPASAGGLGRWFEAFARQPARIRIVHFWSAEGARRLLADAVAELGGGHVIVDAAALLTTLERSEWLQLPPVCVIAASAREAATVRSFGVEVARIALVRPGVDFGAITADQRTRFRSELDLADDAIAALILPPVSASAASRIAAWGALLAQRVFLRLRIIVPGTGFEVDRIARMADASNRGWILRMPEERLSIDALVSACDVSLFSPSRDAPAAALAWAMAARRPIVATATPACSELLAQGQNAYLCRPDSPRDVAKRLIELLDSPANAAELVRAAHSQAYTLFSRQRMLEQLDRAYQNLAAERPIREGIDDAAAQRVAGG